MQKAQRCTCFFLLLHLFKFFWACSCSCVVGFFHMILLAQKTPKHTKPKLGKKNSGNLVLLPVSLSPPQLPIYHHLPRRRRPHTPNTEDDTHQTQRENRARCARVRCKRRRRRWERRQRRLIQKTNDKRWWYTHLVSVCFVAVRVCAWVCFRLCRRRRGGEGERRREIKEN